MLASILILVALVICSGFFSGTEVAMFSLRRVDRAQMVDSDKRSDQLVVRMLSRPNRLIATILIGNESVNVSASVVMASLVGMLFSGQSEIALALIATFMALPLLLFLGEISPKTIAYTTSAGWARKASRPLWLFWVVVTPIRIVVRLVANAILWPLGAHAATDPSKDLGEDEFKALVDAGSAEGEVDARERRLIHKVFEFGDKCVADVMQPRSEVFALSYQLPLARLIREIGARGYSRVPVYKRGRDQILGILYAKDLVPLANGVAPPKRLSELLHEPLFVPQSTTLERLFRIFKARKTHMALVVNEYGKLIGLVTMEDVLEELFGEIHDEREQQKLSAPRSTPTDEFAVAQVRRAAEKAAADDGGDDGWGLIDEAPTQSDDGGQS